MTGALHFRLKKECGGSIKKEYLDLGEIYLEQKHQQRFFAPKGATGIVIKSVTANVRDNQFLSKETSMCKCNILMLLVSLRPCQSL